MFVTKVVLYIYIYIYYIKDTTLKLNNGATHWIQYSINIALSWLITIIKIV